MRVPLTAMPCASTVSHAATVSHAVAWTNASAKIVTAAIAVETVIVVKPAFSAETPEASVVKKTLGWRGALVEKAGRERRVAGLCKNSPRRDK
jgi:hypothetical protein